MLRMAREILLKIYDVMLSIILNVMLQLIVKGLIIRFFFFQKKYRTEKLSFFKTDKKALSTAISFFEKNYLIPKSMKDKLCFFGILACFVENPFDIEQIDSQIKYIYLASYRKRIITKICVLINKLILNISNHNAVNQIEKVIILRKNIVYLQQLLNGDQAC